jgi:ABC-2 type transport system ATP-binding protein
VIAVDPGATPGSTLLLARGVRRRFGAEEALKGVDLEVRGGQIHALLGPNGAGKTTLVRILSGLAVASAGEVTFHSRDGTETPAGWDARTLVGVVPSGDRTFYLRLSGLQNLVFFGRLHGLPRRRARQLATAALGDVGLAHAADRRVGEYSHGMTKRLGVARALLAAPPVLLVDEATHDLDPDGGRLMRQLVRRIADQGTAVVWATQRLDEIRGFADAVTLLKAGQVRFHGSVDQLIAAAERQGYVLRLRDRYRAPDAVVADANTALGSVAQLGWLDPRDPEHFSLLVARGVPLGTAMNALAAASIEVLSCREERSGIEEAFLSLTGEGAG